MCYSYQNDLGRTSKTHLNAAMPDWVCRVPESTFFRCVKYLLDIGLDPVNSTCPQLHFFFFFSQIQWNLLLFCCKIQYFMVARHLTFGALSSCPFTCIHFFFPSVFFTIRNSFDYSKYPTCSLWLQISRGQGTENEFHLVVKDWEDYD